MYVLNRVDTEKHIRSNLYYGTYGDKGEFKITLESLEELRKLGAVLLIIPTFLVDYINIEDTMIKTKDLNYTEYSSLFNCVINVEDIKEFIKMTDSWLDYSTLYYGNITFLIPFELEKEFGGWLQAFSDEGLNYYKNWMISNIYHYNWKIPFFNILSTNIIDKYGKEIFYKKFKTEKEEDLITEVINKRNEDIRMKKIEWYMGISRGGDYLNDKSIEELENMHEIIYSKGCDILGALYTGYEYPDLSKNLFYYKEKPKIAFNNITI